MTAAKRVAAVLIAASASACAGDPSVGPRQETGAGIGAITGALIGSSVAGGNVGNRLAGAAVGAVAGGVLGSAIGASLDEQDRRRAYEAEMAALEYGQPGAPTAWRSERTTYYGTVVPGPYYEQRGRRCREYTHTVYIQGRPQAARGVACRNPDGSWALVS